MGNTPQSYSSQGLEGSFPPDPTTTTGRVQDDGWSILTWAGHYDKNGNWSTKENWSDYYDNDGVFAYGRLLQDYQTRCPTTDHNGHVVACIDAQTFQGLPTGYVSGSGLNEWTFAPGTQGDFYVASEMALQNWIVTNSYFRTACGDESRADILPLFYYPYDKPWNAQVIENYIKKDNIAPACAALLRNNTDPDVQEKYGLLGMPKFWAPAAQGGYYAINAAEQATNVATEWMFKAQDWQIDYGWHLALYPGMDNWLSAEDQAEFMKAYPNFADSYVAPGHINPGFMGDPFWSPQDRAAFQAKILMQAPQNPNRSGGQAPYPLSDKTITAPGYQGHLPDLQTAFNQGNSPISPWRGGGAGKSYEDPCEQSGIVSSVMPFLGAGVLGFGGISAFGLDDLPAAAGTLSWAVGGYFLGKSLFGVEQYAQYGYWQMSYARLSIILLSTGALVGLSGDLSKASTVALPAEFDLPLAVVLGVVGFFVVAPRLIDMLEPLLKDVSGVTSPFAAFDDWVTKWLWNGCVKEEFASPGSCLCTDAAKLEGGKEALIEDWLKYYLIVTGDQYSLRQACLRGRLARGPWQATGGNPNLIGSCDVDSQTMTNPMACLSSGAWMYRAPWIPSNPRSGPLEIEMWNEIESCFADDNPSALPPATDDDRNCQAKYGEYFRYDPASKSCKNFLAPPQQVEDPDAQGPGQFDFEGLLKNGYPAPPDGGLDCKIL